MKKLTILIAAVALVCFSVPAMAVDWNFYGSARIATFYTSTDGGDLVLRQPVVDRIKTLLVLLDPAGNCCCMHAGKEGGAPGRAALLGIIGHKPRAFIREAIDVGRLPNHESLMVSTHVHDADVIAHNK